MTEEHENPKKLPSIIRTLGTINAIELVKMHLSGDLIIMKAPLSYVIFDNDQPYPVETQVANMVTGASYTNIME